MFEFLAGADHANPAVTAPFVTDLHPKRDVEKSADDPAHIIRSNLFRFFFDAGEHRGIGLVALILFAQPLALGGAPLLDGPRVGYRRRLFN